MKSKLIVVSSGIAAVVLSIWMPMVHAVLITPGSSFRLDYDFSTNPFTGPYGDNQYDMTIGGDAFEMGDVITFDAFDSSNSLIGSDIYSQIFGFDLTNVEVSSEIIFDLPTPDPVGYIILTSLDATFELSEFKWQLRDSPLTTGRVSLPIQPIPLPSAIYLFSSVLLGLIGTVRRRISV